MSLDFMLVRFLSRLRWQICNGNRAIGQVFTGILGVNEHANLWGKGLAPQR